MQRALDLRKFRLYQDSDAFTFHLLQLRCDALSISLKSVKLYREGSFEVNEPNHSRPSQLELITCFRHASSPPV